MHFRRGLLSRASTTIGEDCKVQWLGKKVKNRGWEKICGRIGVFRAFLRGRSFLDARTNLYDKRKCSLFEERNVLGSRFSRVCSSTWKPQSTASCQFSPWLWLKSASGRVLRFDASCSAFSHHSPRRNDSCMRMAVQETLRYSISILHGENEPFVSLFPLERIILSRGKFLLESIGFR